MYISETMQGAAQLGAQQNAAGANDCEYIYQLPPVQNAVNVLPKCENAMFLVLVRFCAGTVITTDSLQLMDDPTSPLRYWKDAPQNNWYKYGINLQHSLPYIGNVADHADVVEVIDSSKRTFVEEFPFCTVYARGDSSNATFGDNFFVMKNFSVVAVEAVVMLEKQQ